MSKQPKTYREQKLVDITFEIALLLTSEKYADHFRKLGRDGVAEYVANQLNGCGFPTTPVGSSWGVLPDKY